jgi:hypothetical protein
MVKKYTVSDGKLVLTLEPMPEGGYLVRCPMDPELLTGADDLGEAFGMARDALRGLRASRRKWVAQMRRGAANL